MKTTTMAVLQLLLLFFYHLLLPSNSHVPDAEILLQTKKDYINDPNGSLDDWSPSSNLDHCNWSGITCDFFSRGVSSIDLSDFDISGRFPCSFCWIPTLQNLSLAFNSLTGSISSQDISPCSHLHHLNLSLNYFTGNLPEFEPQFSNLLSLDLSQNNFSGNIPPSFGRFPKLQVLGLFYNMLNGTIPSFLTNLTELVRFELAMNPFSPGPLPLGIGNLTKLENLWLPSSNLIGSIPNSIGRLAALKNLDLSDNYLSGRIPDGIGGLKSVEQIELYQNNISGDLPEGLGNLTNLRLFDASQNTLTGKLTEKLAALQLISLALNDNHLEGEVPAVLALNPNLIQLKLFNNSFLGALPADLGRHSDLLDFDISTNQFEGEFPQFLCSRGKLISLVTFNNHLSGNLSSYYGQCNSLEYVRIFNNEISGYLPEGLWSLPRIYHLELTNNRFEGSVPPTISNALEKLLIGRNQFSGQLPVQICALQDLTVIDAGINHFSGRFPSCLTEMKQLQKLNLQENMLSGEIPTRLSSWTQLTTLNLSTNRISGEIPGELGCLPVLNYLDLSNNLLSGKIPDELTNLKLNQLNLSTNNLAGKIPHNFDSNLYVPSFLGNPNLCSPDLKPFPPCPNSEPISWILLSIILLTFISLLLLSLFWSLNRKSNLIGGNKLSSSRSWKMVSFHRFSFKEDEILASLTEPNLIGTGSSGKVYRARLNSGHTVAVKKLRGRNENCETERVFESEIETLGKIRHGNIVKLYFSFSCDDFRVLGYEFMEMGSLGEVLHGEKGGFLLNWERRLGIAIGAAQGLAYIHHDCIPAIVHRDVKSNNILLDSEFCARLADFGLAKTMMECEGGSGDGDQSGMSRIAGSYGYIAPECGYTVKVTEKSDVYSFGVVLMELVTGKRPTDSEFGEGKDIIKWVTDATTTTSGITTMARLHQLVDPRMDLSCCNFKEIEKLVNVALLCTTSFPMNRPSMRKVVELLKNNKDVADDHPGSSHPG